MWDLTDPPDALTIDDRLAMIDELPRFGTPIHVVFTGGEPFQKLPELLALAGRLREHGFTSSVVTSGFFLTEAVTERLIGSGLTHLVLSIDFPTAAQHDAQRGRPGTFERATRAIRELVAARKAGRSAPTVGINTIVMAQTVNYLEDVVELATDLGVQELLFQPVQPDFGLSDDVSLVRLGNWLPLDLRHVDDAIARVERLRGSAPLGQTASELGRVADCLRDPRRVQPGTCQSARRNLVVDVAGWVWHCFGQTRTPWPALGRVPMDDLVTLWESSSSRDGRHALASCNLGCGALLCHSRSSQPPTSEVDRAVAALLRI